MKAGDLVKTFDKEKSDWRAVPPKVVYMVGMLIRPVIVELGKWSGPDSSPILNPGWEVMGPAGLFERSTKNLQPIDFVPEHIQDMIRARDFVSQKIADWQEKTKL